MRKTSPLYAEGKEIQGFEGLKGGWMKTDPYPILEMKESLQRLAEETNRLMKLSKGIPGIEKNITPIMAFIDILKFHLDIDDEC